MHTAYYHILFHTRAFAEHCSFNAYHSFFVGYWLNMCVTLSFYTFEVIVLFYELQTCFILYLYYIS